MPADGLSSRPNSRGRSFVDILEALDIVLAEIIAGLRSDSLARYLALRGDSEDGFKR